MTVNKRHKRKTCTKGKQSYIHQYQKLRDTCTWEQQWFYIYIYNMTRYNYGMCTSTDTEYFLYLKKEKLF